MPRYQENLAVFRKDEVDSMLSGVKDYLQEATGATTKSRDDDHPLRDGVYTVNESDVQGLVYHILDLADQVWKKRRPQDTTNTATETVQLFSPAPRSMCPVASTTVDPVTTITTSEASFTPAVGTDDGGRQGAQAATTTTVISRDNVTEITWLHPSGSAPAVDAEVESIPDCPSPGTPRSTDQSKKAKMICTLDYPAQTYPVRRSSVDSRYSITVNHGPGSSIGNNTRKRRQSSMVVFTGGDELDPEGGSQSAEVSDEPTTVFGKIRKKSVQFGQTMGSFMNGAYQNADHKPRRDSSEFSFGLTRFGSMLIVCEKVLYA